MAMTCRKNVQLAEDGGKQPQRGGGAAERTYGYIDLFKAMGDRLPLEIYPLSKKIVLVGRDPSCDIKIKNARISRQQCEVRVISEGQSFKVKIPPFPPEHLHAGLMTFAILSEHLISLLFTLGVPS